jgi:glycosyltransferase involved in cell wall biosynthesis
MKVSVVVPCYNSARYIEGTLDALGRLEPGEHELEIILVDDGSTDDTAERIKYRPVTLIRQPNGGPAAARNSGWRAASGEIVCFTDADCIPPAGWLRCLLAGFEIPEVGAVAGSYEAANPGRLLARLIQAEIAYRHRRMPQFVRAGGTYNLAVRRVVLEAVGGFDESFPAASGEDNDLSYRIRRAGHRIAFCPQCRVAHYHPEAWLAYLRTQYIHGYWRSRLHRKHPVFLSGDDYTRLRDILDCALALGIIPAGIAAGAGWPGAAWAVAGLAAALLGLESWAAAGIAREAREIRLLFAGLAVFTVRAFARMAGWISGLVSAAFGGRAFAGGRIRR